MKRTLFEYLEKWLISPDRKPLVIRGARQVGKTWLVRHLAEQTDKRLVELNFEKKPSYASLFDTNDPEQILLNLSSITNQKLEPENCLLFLDEIQAAPLLFSKLRWFAEDMPKLAVVAAGSLLEFVLTEHSFSMPVGRINYLHLEPMSFEEFLLASNKNSLVDYLSNYHFNVEIPVAIHENLSLSFKEYLLVGGMPAVVSSWIKERTITKISQIQNDLLATYRDDFSKYRGRIAIERLDEVMSAIPRMLGQKFVFSKVNSAIQATAIKQVLELLERARLCCRVQCCSANGLPLASELKEKYFKEIFLDIGLCSTALGLNLSQLSSFDEIIMINNGAIAEQVVGQILRTVEPAFIEPKLYYWQRDVAGSSAEIDYVLQHNYQIIPVEVKAGSTGSLKSLHFFMGQKKYPLALRVNSDYPSNTKVDLKDNLGNSVKYSLISIPFYLLKQIHRLLDLEAS